MSKFKNLAGEKFGKLTVLSRANDYVKPSGQKIIQWNCLCDCGNETVVRGEYLKSGHTKSCGCNTHISRSITHGQSKTRLYKIWIGIRGRCYNPNRNCYRLYGERGIILCDEWFDFENFYNWSMGNGYSDELTIDRINNDLGYSPSNCRWATCREQANNKRNNRIVECDGELHTVGEWSTIVGIAQNTIRMRLDVYGWDADRAIKTPVHSHKKYKTIQNKTKGENTQ